jgi:hypothetical protein
MAELGLREDKGKEPHLAERMQGVPRHAAAIPGRPVLPQSRRARPPTVSPVSRHLQVLRHTVTVTPWPVENGQGLLFLTIQPLSVPRVPYLPHVSHLSALEGLAVSRSLAPAFIPLIPDTPPPL